MDSFLRSVGSFVHSDVIYMYVCIIADVHVNVPVKTMLRRIPTQKKDK
jgi:hypothetical protein